VYASLRATRKPLYQPYVAQFPLVDIGYCCFWQTGHYSTSIEFVATDSQKVLQVGLVSKFRPLGLGIGHACFDRDSDSEIEDITWSRPEADASATAAVGTLMINFLTVFTCSCMLRSSSIILARRQRNILYL
jgi:hypothetical protein